VTTGSASACSSMSYGTELVMAVCQLDSVFSGIV